MVRRTARNGTNIPPCERFEIGIRAIAPKANIKKIAKDHGVHFTYVYDIRKKILLYRKLYQYFGEIT